MLNSLKLVVNRSIGRLDSRCFSVLKNFGNFQEFFASAKCDVVSNAPIMVHSDKVQNHANQSSNLIVSKSAAALVSMASPEGSEAIVEGQSGDIGTAIPPYSMDLQPATEKHNLKLSS